VSCVLADTLSTASVDVGGDMSDEGEFVALVIEDMFAVMLDFEAECLMDGVSSDSRTFWLMKHCNPTNGRTMDDLNTDNG
jgi:hypothetical protein